MRDRLLRTFIAISVPPAVKSVKQMLISTMEDEKAEIRWVKHNNLHLTVKFLGFTPENEIANIMKNNPEESPPKRITMEDFNIWKWRKCC